MVSIANRSSRSKIQTSYLFLFVFLLYAFRFVYCYTSYLKIYKWLDIGDESHVYLLGLKFFTSHTYPYWGPDIFYTSTYMVGGMQGLLVGAPFFIWAHPFAPYALLFILMSAALICLSWYISKLLPQMPAWLIYAFIGLSPHTMHTGLQVINPAYVMCFAIPFFLSFIEVLGIFKQQYIHPRWRYFWMGLGITSVFQLHASWVLLFLSWSIAMFFTLIKPAKKNAFSTAVLYSGIGVLLGAASLVPVIYEYGFSPFFMQGKNVSFDIGQFSYFGGIAFYMLTLCGYEMNSFTDVYIWGGLLQYSSIYSAIVFAVLQTAGLLLVAAQVIVLFFKPWRSYISEYKKLLVLVASFILLLSLMYLFSFVKPMAHAMLCLFPLSALLGCTLLDNLVRNTRVKPVYFAGFLGLMLVYYCITIDITNKLPGLGFRAKAFEAIEKKDASIFEVPRFLYPEKNSGE